MAPGMRLRHGMPLTLAATKKADPLARAGPDSCDRLRGEDYGGVVPAPVETQTSYAFKVDSAPTVEP